MNKNFHSLILLLLPLNLLAQTIHDGLEFSKTEFNFPKEENWVSSIDTIQVTNRTAKTIHLLKQSDPRGFELRFPGKGVDPGKTEPIEIIFKPKEAGKFNFSFPIYHSASLTPVTITYKGDILSFDEFATTACPSFYKPNLKPIDFQLEIAVIDSVTKKPIGNSFIELTTGEYYSQHTTDSYGLYKQQAGINYYLVFAEHPGYLSRSVGRHVNPKNRKITVALPSAAKENDLPATPTYTAPIPAVEKALLPEPLNLQPGFPASVYKKNNIIFLIDKSSSMNKPDCMPLLQLTMTQLANMTRTEDRVTIITYANEAKVLLPGTKGNEHEKIIAIIEQLKCGGRTEGGKAILTAYKNAEDNFIKGGINQVIIATDGGFNGLSENEAELMQLADTKAKEGIKLSVLAFGQNRFGKALITRIAKQGTGFYVFIGNEEDAKTKLNETIKLQSQIK
jgi:Mg-chelatase subunit ChlD